MSDQVVTKSAQNGQSIPLFGGIHLCSAMNPQREAERWVQRHLDFLNGSPVIVLGLGAGFHAEAVSRITSEPVIVFERRPELIAWFRENLATSLTRLRIHAIDADRTSERMNHLYELLGEPYSVVLNPYSWRMDREFYQPIYHWLLGRGEKEFEEQLSRRPHQKEFFAQMDFRHPGESENLSYGRIQEGVEGVAASSREAQLWKTLGELVK